MPSRRSARVHQHDPILYPGFGTAKDLQKLAADLSSESSKLPVEAVEAIMTSRGRGLNASEDAAPVISNAWASFMQEEGVGNTSNTATTTTTTTSSSDKRKSPGRKAEEDKAIPSADTNRVYIDVSSYKKNKLTAGALVQTGTLDVTTVGRTKSTDVTAYHLTIPTVLSLPRKITSVFTSCSAVHSIAVAENGTCYGWGRNEAQQLTAQLPQNVYYPTELPCPPVQSAATGKSHTILLYKDGTLWAVGSNKSGQCGIKSKVESVPNFKSMPFEGEVQQITAGEDFTVVLSTDGIMYTTGSSEYGQLGNGETGEYFVTASKLAFANCQVLTPQTTFCYCPGEKLHTSSSEQKVVPLNEKIKIGYIAAGKHHTLAVEAASNQPSRVFSWGCGHYGVLGHGRVADEYFPRLIGVLPHVLSFSKEPPTVSAGAHCSLLQNNGHVYYWGQHRNNAEAVLRPQLVDVLAHNQHVVTQMAAGGQTVFCSTAAGQTVAWGQGPHGELGLETAKSSAKPTFVTKLDGCMVQSLACGYGHTLFVVEESAVKTFVTIEPDAVEELTNRKEKEPPAKKKKVTRK
jgi:alpha-tubulin suppressor-like RCC1 family protein